MTSNLTRHALHLGAIHEVHHGSAFQLRRQASLANNAWCSYRHFWHDRSVPLVWRARVFESVIFNRLIDDLETTCLTDAQLRFAESFIVRKLRCLLQHTTLTNGFDNKCASRQFSQC